MLIVVELAIGVVDVVCFLVEFVVSISLSLTISSRFLFFNLFKVLSRNSKKFLFVEFDELNVVIVTVVAVVVVIGGIVVVFSQ